MVHIIQIETLDTDNIAEFVRALAENITNNKHIYSLKDGKVEKIDSDEPFNATEDEDGNMVEPVTKVYAVLYMNRSMKRIDFTGVSKPIITRHYNNINATETERKQEDWCHYFNDNPSELVYDMLKDPMQSHNSIMIDMGHSKYKEFYQNVPNFNLETDINFKEVVATIKAHTYYWFLPEFVDMDFKLNNLLGTVPEVSTKTVFERGLMIDGQIHHTRPDKMICSFSRIPIFHDYYVMYKDDVFHPVARPFLECKNNASLRTVIVAKVNDQDYSFEPYRDMFEHDKFEAMLEMYEGECNTDTSKYRYMYDENSRLIVLNNDTPQFKQKLIKVNMELVNIDFDDLTKKLDAPEEQDEEEEEQDDDE